MDASVDSARELRLVADPTRAHILRSILEAPDGRVLVGRLAEELGLRQPTVSHHMKALLDEGLVQRHPDGRRTWYSLADEHADRLAEILRAQESSVPVDPVLERVVRDLSDRYRGTFSPETVERYVRESYDLLADRPAPGRRLASLASQFAADRLDALAREEPGAGSEIPEVLFVCVQNAGRSQMASAILRHLAGDRVHVRTAGSDPAGEVRSSVLTALDEIGVPLAGEYPKPLTDEVVRAADVVITMGCGDACPIYPGRRYLDWDLPDPVGKPITEVREIRDDIERRIRELLATL
ncbi:metalloregulator ArsR/SmtB family transcription factor [Agromyces sp. CFH 90414]|uniref:Metalloregulator ArsR/SmtB family transcription factor n=1 Tax=Agromyces agglutinans TaxID=2662258 RepID=A0A6I2F2Y5_9MICO|nr:metalloregulator ArsR/SmtB family transcription factor [Agromyces agglutinans]MRG58899.1 metalloregulator ArsR/SmtB family transcription factor [Agromyces agglutinans]